LAMASSVAAAAPTKARARRLELWSGAVLARAGDAAGMQQRLGAAARMALEQERPAERCEALALLALEAARLSRNEQSCLAVAERSAQTVLREASSLPGHPPWSAQANAALARVALIKGEADAAAESGGRALAELDGAVREDLSLDIILPSAEAVLTCGSDTDAGPLRARLQLLLELQAQRILDDDVRAEWFKSETGQELARLAGRVAVQNDGRTEGHGLTEDDSRLLRLVVEGRTNHEIAEEVGVDEQIVARRLAELFVRIGASSRAGAMVAALTGGLI